MYRYGIIHALLQPTDPTVICSWFNCCMRAFSFIGFSAIVDFAAIGGLFVVSFFLSSIFLG